ncbi:MAG: winged helix-turn-helix domain-containing protein [Eubacteriales bacterium]
MPKSACVVSRDTAFAQFVRLELLPYLSRVTVVPEESATAWPAPEGAATSWPANDWSATSWTAPEGAAPAWSAPEGAATSWPAADLYVIDLDTVSLPGHPLTGRVLCCSHSQSRPDDFPYLWADRPFRPAKLTALLELTADRTPEGLWLFEQGGRPIARFDGREVALTEREYRLLSVLMAAGGGVVSRETLFEQVWGGQGETGVVNVYIHYLRRKLEAGGRKLIESRKGRGYALFPDAVPSPAADETNRAARR